MENTKKPRIVAVDDAAFVCETLTSWLRGPYEIHTFLGGAEAVAYLNQHGADLVLLDYDMPEMTGFEVLMKIRHNTDFGKSVPVIFLTAVTNERMEEEMLERGANAYIRKPLDLAVLKKTIAKFLPN
ncbi:MAG: response regulator [Lachnospiraceae bacterium]|nr:response regulator [Lachnospiraceae bacterium]